MGSSASRVAGVAARQYPTRTPPTTSAAATNAPGQLPPAFNSRPGPTVRPQAHVSEGRDEAINLDASDPDFAHSLRTLGPVQPNPTLSPTSAFSPQQAVRPAAPSPRDNPALTVLDARARLQDEAEKEFMAAGRRGHEGRQFLDVHTIRQMLVQRDEFGKSAAEIERSMGLKAGVVERLGGKRVVELANEMGRARKEVDLV